MGQSDSKTPNEQGRFLANTSTIINKDYLENHLLKRYDLFHNPTLTKITNEMNDILISDRRFVYNTSLKEYLESVGLSNRLIIMESYYFDTGLYFLIYPTICKENLIIFINELWNMRIGSYDRKTSYNVNITTDELKDVRYEASKLYERVNIKLEGKFEGGKLAKYIILELGRIINNKNIVENPKKIENVEGANNINDINRAVNMGNTNYASLDINAPKLDDLPLDIDVDIDVDIDIPIDIGDAYNNEEGAQK